MQALAEQGPALKAQSVTLISHANGDTSVAGSAAALLDGATDAVAGATLQEAVQIMAGQTGTSITSAETLPGMAAGGWRRIGVRVSIRASWPALIQLLQSIEQGVPRMLVDDVQLHAPPVPPDPAVARAAGVPIDASFSVYAFRLATAERP
jgi:general secretion pathway protein M